MNKEELLQELSVKLNTGEISREEITGRLGLTQTIQPKSESDKETKKFSQFSVTKMLYVLGAAIVIIGIFVFVTQIWNDINSFSRITITLGLGLLIAAIGSMLLKQKPENDLGAIFHFISGMLIPGGAMVTLYELEIDLVSLWPVAISFGVIFTFYLLLNTIHKHPVLTFFTIANGTAFIYLFFGAIIGKLNYRNENIYAYLTMIIGSNYILLAHAFRRSWNKNLLGALCFFGSAGFLGAAFSQVFDSVPWQLLYFLIIISGLFLSVYMKSRSILTMSTLFLIAHISYITRTYFTDSLGWPISLIMLGFVFIGLGYASITINKKYIKKTA